MLKKRLQAFTIFEKLPLPKFGPDLSKIDLSKIDFFRPADFRKARSWKKVPAEIKKTFDQLGLPQAEQRFLAGLGIQVDSSMTYQSLKEKWQKQGIIFEDMDTAVKKYPELVKKYFMTECVRPDNNKFAALHGALWSGGSFVYFPKGAVLKEPIEGYFFLKSRQAGQFEHSLIIAREDSQIKYIEGCSAPQYAQNCLHSGVVEIFVARKARVSYLTIQNWSRNIYNLNTKRALVDKKGRIEWISGSFGSKATMFYPTSILQGRKAQATHLSLSLASKNQDLDTGGKVIHQAQETSSNIVAKTIVRANGKASYRGLAKIEKGAKESRTSINCDNLLLSRNARADTYPALVIEEKESRAYHEAKTGKIAEGQLFYLMSRGLSEQEATSLIVSGFLEPIVAKFPVDYAAELDRLINLEIEKGKG